MRKFLLPLVAAAGMVVAVGNVVQAAEMPFPSPAVPTASAGRFEAPTVQQVYYGGWHDQRWAEHERWVRWHRWHEWHHWHHYGAGYGY